jgi:hypothetical protein
MEVIVIITDNKILIFMLLYLREWIKLKIFILLKWEISMRKDISML